MSIARAETRKLLTLPSLRLTALLTWAGTALLAFARAPAPLVYAQAGFLVLGVLAAASEHQAGDQIRTTLLAMPRRLPLIVAKTGTLAAVTLPVAAVTAVIGAMPATAIPYLLCTTLLAAAAGGLVRHAVPALLPLLVLYFVAGPLLRGRFAAYLPDTAVLEPSRGAAATIIWTLCAGALSAVVFCRRDAA